MVGVDGTDLDDEIRLTYNGNNIETPDTLVMAGSGSDTINGSDANSCVDSLYGEDGNDTIIGNAGNDFLYGGNNADVIEGNDGSDYINGNGGNDILQGGDNDDEIDGGDGNDTIQGGGEADILNGEGNNDTIEGGDGDDTIDGGNGDDILRGGADDDTLIGGHGADVLCGGGIGNSFNTFYAGPLGVAEFPPALDKLWQPNVTTPPVGTAASNDECGHATYFAGWAGSCADSLFTQPAECN